MRILVVDDSAIMRKVIIRELSNLNFDDDDIVEAADGNEALQIAKEKTFSLILMDWNMPNLSGIEALFEIRSAGITTPIMMVTTEAERGQIITAIQAGANNYMVKPFTPEDLKEKLLQILGTLPPPKKEQRVDMSEGKIIQE